MRSSPIRSDRRAGGPRPPQGRVLLLGLLLFLLSLSALTAVPDTEAATSGTNPPQGVHLTYLDDPTAAAVTWHTMEPATSRVEWGTSPGGPYSTAVSGTDYLSPGGSYLHTARLTGLTPGTLYYYRVGDVDMASWWGERAFRTAPSTGSSGAFSFAAFGDFGNTSAGVGVANGTASARPDLVLGLGDYYSASDDASVRGVYEIWQSFAAGSFLQLGMGNHEHGTDTDSLSVSKETHCAFVNLPGNERSYAFQYGNTFFLTLDWGRAATANSVGVDGTGDPCGGDTGTAAIRAWADTQLAAADADPSVTWKVVTNHYPCYNPTDSATDLLCPQNGDPDRLEDLMVTYGVHLVLNGHIHNYARTHPVEFNTTVQQGSTYDSPGAPIYLTIGTGGNIFPWLGGCRTDPWVAACRATEETAGFGFFSVSDTTLSYEFVENEEGVVDAFTLTKGTIVTRSFQKGDGGAYSETDDTFLFGGAPNTTHGGDERLLVDGDGCLSLSLTPEEVCRALIKFPDFLGPNADQVPLGSNVLDASLEISVISPGTAHDVYQVTESWTEAGATWNSFATPGFPANTGLALSYNPSRITRLSLNLTAIVQSWSDGAVNEGILIASTNADGGTYASSDSATPSTLTVTFQPPPSSFDFNLSADPDFGAVERGESASTSLTATLLSGDPSAVSFDVAGGEPSGSTFSFSPSQCTPTCTSTMTVTTSDKDPFEGGTPAGRYTINVSASGGGVTRWTEYTLVVNATFNFTLSLDPESGTVSAGESTDTTVTTTWEYGEQQPVSFVATGLPAGSSATFSPDACTPPCTSVMTVATSTDTPAGTYTIAVNASGGGTTRTASYALTVTEGGESTTLSFQKGDGGAYSETDDALIYSGAPDTNYGSATVLYVDASDCGAAGTVCWSLIKFPAFMGPNAGQVPLGATIVDATLELTISNSGGTQSAYQVTEVWTEAGVTWNAFAVPGEPGTTGTVISYASPTGVVVLNITAIVQNWANGEANQGLFITTSSTDGTDYLSSESSTPPTLTVTFEAGDAPSSAFDFTLSAEPESGSVVRGESTSTTVAADLTSGDPSAVSFDATGVPTGATVTFSPTGCTPTCDTTMTVATSTSTPAQTYTINVSASGGGVARWTLYTLVVNEPFDFSLAADPTSGSVLPGESASTSVTAALSSGEPATVSFGATGQISGATGSFSPAECVPTCTSTLTITTSADTPPGTYEVTVSATGGGITRTTSYTLVVEEPFDFSLTVDPSSGTVSQGDSISTSVTATLTSGDPNAVSFTATGVPSGATASFSSTQCLPICKTTLTVSTTADTPTGTYTITVEATDGTITRSTTFTLEVVPPPDFSVSASQTYMSLHVGESDDCTITLTSLFGFSGDVDLTTSIRAVELIDSIVYPTVSLSPTSVSLASGGSATSTLTVSASLLTTPGTYEITVTATSGSITHSVTITLEVTLL